MGWEISRKAEEFYLTYSLFNKTITNAFAIFNPFVSIIIVQCWLLIKQKYILQTKLKTTLNEQERIIDLELILKFENNYKIYKTVCWFVFVMWNLVIIIDWLLEVANFFNSTTVCANANS